MRGVSLLFYILPTIIALILPEQKYVLQCVLLYPLVELSVCAVHESSHALLFHLSGAKLKILRIGAFEFDFLNKCLNFEKLGLFSGNCTADIPKDVNRKIIIAAIVSGGVSGILIAAIFLCIGILESFDSPVILVYIFTGFSEGGYALLFPNSTDRKLLKKWTKNK